MNDYTRIFGYNTFKFDDPSKDAASTETYGIPNTLIDAGGPSYWETLLPFWHAASIALICFAIMCIVIAIRVWKKR